MVKAKVHTGTITDSASHFCMTYIKSLTFFPHAVKGTEVCYVSNATEVPLHTVQTLVCASS